MLSPPLRPVCALFLFVSTLSCVAGCKDDRPPPPTATERPAATSETVPEAALRPDSIATASTAKEEVKESTPSARAPDLLDWWSEAGDSALVTVAIDPFYPWEPTAKLMVESIPRKDITEPIFGVFRTLETFSQAIGEAVAMAGYRNWPREWPGLDPDRPVLAALFAPLTPMTNPSDWLLTALALDQGVSGMRHDILLPATDVSRLFGAVISALSPNLESVPPEAVDTMRRLLPKGAEAFALSNGLLAVLPEEGHLRVSLLLHHLRPTDSPAELDAELVKWLQSPRASMTQTPALAHVIDSDAPVRAYVRPDRLRAVAMQVGVAQAAQALGMASPELRADYETTIAAILGRTWAFLSPVTLLYQDIGATLVAEGAWGLDVVSTLTAAGAAVHGARETDPLVVTPAGAEPGVLFAGIDLAAMASRLPKTPLMPDAIDGAVEKQGTLSAIVDTYQECGIWCSIHLLLGGWPTLASVAPEMAAERLPSGLTAVIRTATRDGKEVRPEAAFALALPADADVSWLKMLARQAALSSGWDIKVKTYPLSGKLVATVSINRPVEDLLEMTPTDKFSDRIRVSLRTAVLADALLGIDADLPRWLGKLEEAVFDLTRSGNAVVFRYWQGPGGRPLKVGPAPKVQSQAEALPEKTAGALAQARCIDHAVFALANGLSDISRVAPEFRLATFNKLAQSIGAARSCAGEEGDKALSEMAGAVLHIAAAREATAYRRDTARALLDLACQQGRAEACEESKRLERLPALWLASVPATCPTAGIPDRDEVIAINEQGSWIGETLVAPTTDGQINPEALVTALERLGKPPYFVAFDRHTPGQLAQQILAVLRSIPEASVRLVVDAGQQPALVKVSLFPGSAGHLPTVTVGPDQLMVHRKFQEEAKPFAWSRTEVSTIGAELRAYLAVMAGFPVHVLWGDDGHWQDAAMVAAELACNQVAPLFKVYVGPTPATLAKASPGAIQGPGPGRLPGGRSLLALEAKRRGVRKLLPKLRRCFDAQLKSMPKLTIKSTLQLAVDETGAVTGATLLETSQSLPEFEACVVEQAQRLKFGTGEPGRTLNIPIIFKSP